MRLKDKVVIVTASTRGIGYSIVEACAKAGAIVYMAVRNTQKAKELARELNQQGYRVHVVYCDASKYDSYQTMVDEVITLHERIDVLVNNFGTSNPQTDLDIVNTKYEDFMETMDINLASVFKTTQAVLPHMIKQNSGSIINISSIGGLVPDVSRIGYGVSKAAIIYLTQNIALQVGGYNIRCNAVLPGMIATDAVKENMSEQFNDMFLKHTVFNRMGEPEEIADAVVYFASDESRYTTGQVLAVSGGFGLGTPIYGDIKNLKSKR